MEALTAGSKRNLEIQPGGFTTPGLVFGPSGNPRPRIKSRTQEEGEASEDEDSQPATKGQIKALTALITQHIVTDKTWKEEVGNVVGDLSLTVREWVDKMPAIEARVEGLGSSITRLQEAAKLATQRAKDQQTNIADNTKATTKLQLQVTQMNTDVKTLAKKLEDEVAALDRSVVEFGSKVAALKAGPPNSEGGTDGMKAKVAALQARVAEMAERMNTTPVVAPNGSDEMMALREEVVQLRGIVTQASKQPAWAHRMGAQQGHAGGPPSSRGSTDAGGRGGIQDAEAGGAL